MKIQLNQLMLNIFNDITKPFDNPRIVAYVDQYNPASSTIRYTVAIYYKSLEIIQPVESEQCTIIHTSHYNRLSDKREIYMEIDVDLSLHTKLNKSIRNCYLLKKMSAPAYPSAFDTLCHVSDATYTFNKQYDKII